MTTTPVADPKPIIDGARSDTRQTLVVIFIGVPMIALAAAIPFAWGWGLGWTDVIIGAVCYVITGLGVTVGFHRYLTHGGFKARRPLRIALAVAGSMSLQGAVIEWVANHRRHHAFADKEGDPHSPWLFGTGARGVAKGFWHSHTGWLLERQRTNEDRFAPDLIADPDIHKVDRLFPVLTVASLATPALLGGLISWSWWGALTAFFWAGLVRVAVLHHVTWSVNSICHMVGERPFSTRDRSTNFWPLAIASFGESWHNLHHAEPTSARHGVKRGQIDLSARLIWVFEKLRWASDVRWPKPERLEKLSAAQ